MMAGQLPSSWRCLNENFGWVGDRQAGFDVHDLFDRRSVDDERRAWLRAFACGAEAHDWARSARAS